MNIQAREIASTYATNTAKSSNSISGNSSAISSDMFYQMLAAQLQYQDPMESVDSSQMIMQMAQFAQIESSNNLTQQFNLFLEMNSMSIGSSMVGQEVTVSVPNEEGGHTTKTGIVDRVGFTSSGPVLQVDGEYYEFWNVITIGNVTETTQPE